MIPSPKLIAAVGTVLVAAAFAAGRLSAPKCPRLELDHSRDVLAKVDEKAKGAEVQQLATASASDHQVKRKITKTVKKPDGTVATTTSETETHDQATTATLATARASWEREATTRIEDIERTHLKQLAEAQPDWSLAAIAGINVPERERFLGGVATYRVLGPAEVGIYASTRLDFAVVVGGHW